jgi:hypothetical protein
LISFYIPPANRHYELGDFVPNARDAGWDYCAQSLLLSPQELKQVVKDIRNPDLLKVKLEVIHGRELIADDLNESRENLRDRVTNAFKMLASILQCENEHILVVAHESTIEVFAQIYGVNFLCCKNY